MDSYMKENLEDYLSGDLGEKRKAEWDAYLAANSKAAEQVQSFEESAYELRELRAPHEDGSERQPAPGFYARVMQRVEEERSVPFWMAFLEPLFVKRLAFACLMWFALLGSYSVIFQSDDPAEHTAEMMLSRPPAEYQVRLGSDLEQNRDSMLSGMMASAVRK
jgi:anti-sigma factor RsiW